MQRSPLLRQSLSPGLRNQQSIERIGMVQGQSLDGLRLRLLDRHALQTRSERPFEQLLRHIRLTHTRLIATSQIETALTNAAFASKTDGPR